MKYVIAKYNNVTSPEQSVAFGVIVNANHKLYFRFDKDDRLKRSMKKLNAAFDTVTYEKFGETFKEAYVNSGKAMTTDNAGVRQEIDVNSEEFLLYLSENFQGPYRFTRPLEVEGDNPNFVVDSLMQTLVES